jgi:hypothetical protein
MWMESGNPQPSRASGPRTTRSLCLAGPKKSRAKARASARPMSLVGSDSVIRRFEICEQSEHDQPGIAQRLGDLRDGEPCTHRLACSKRRSSAWRPSLPCSTGPSALMSPVSGFKGLMRLDLAMPLSPCQGSSKIAPGFHSCRRSFHQGKIAPEVLQTVRATEECGEIRRVHEHGPRQPEIPKSVRGAGAKKSKVFVLVIVTSSQRVCQSISRRCVIQCPLATSLSLWA